MGKGQSVLAGKGDSEKYVTFYVGSPLENDI